jgi:hypothetical protein
MEFTEGFLHFSFGDEWRVLKYDEAAVYRRQIGTLPDTKAVDFIGLHGKDLYLIEVKDFHGHRIESQRRLAGGNLSIEIGQKVRDTVAGIVGAQRTAGDAETWSAFAAPLTDRRRAIKVVVWLEYDQPGYPPARQKVRASVQGNVFKKHLRWLTSQVWLCSQDECPLEHLKVTHLPR